MRGSIFVAAAILRESGTKGGICNGHVDKGPAFETAVTVINIGDNKGSLNQIAVARCAGRLRARFDDDDDDENENDDDDDDGYFVTLLRRENAVNFVP